MDYLIAGQLYIQCTAKGTCRAIGNHSKTKKLTIVKTTLKNELKTYE